MNKREEKSKEYLKNSIHIMQKKGYHGTSIKDLTDELGIPKGSFYNYFENKIDYTKKALEYFAEYISQLTWLTVEEENLSSKEKLINTYKKFIDNIKSESLKYGCFIGKLSLELGTNNDEIRQCVDKIHSGMKNRVSDILSQDCFENKDKDEIDYVSNIVIYCWQGAMMRYITSNDVIHLNNFIKFLENFLS